METGGGVPEFEGFIGGGGDEVRAARGKFYGGDRAGVPAESEFEGVGGAGGGGGGGAGGGWVEGGERGERGERGGGGRDGWGGWGGGGVGIVGWWCTGGWWWVG